MPRAPIESIFIRVGIGLYSLETMLHQLSNLLRSLKLYKFMESSQVISRGVLTYIAIKRLINIGKVALKIGRITQNGQGWMS